MKHELERKLAIIDNVWNNYIYTYKSCNKEINFTNSEEALYFNELSGYFGDMFGIIYADYKINSHSEKFAYHISLLQAIYIQQDFIEEMLYIFKCNVNKGHLKKDENYSINRNIRNELVGHPIRKNVPACDESKLTVCKSCGAVKKNTTGKTVLLSSTIFSFVPDKNTIQYARYRRDNNYKFEEMTFKIEDIVARHTEFLNCYFDKIIEKSSKILRSFRKELLALRDIIDDINFEILLKRIEICFEAFLVNYNQDRVNILRKVFERKTEHPMHQDLIDKFYYDLKDSINATIIDIDEIIEHRHRISLQLT